MVNFLLEIFIFCYVVVLVSGFSENLETSSFNEGYSQLFGHDNLMVIQDGKSVHISLDERTGSYFILFFHLFDTIYVRNGVKN